MIEVVPKPERFRLVSNRTEVSDHFRAIEIVPCDKFEAQLTQAWTARDSDRILAVAGIQRRWDIPVFRSIDPKATFRMAARINDYLADRGCRGHDVMLFLSQSESPEQQCPARDRILEVMGARPAERYAFTVR
jgi:hypothetical protein